MSDKIRDLAAFAAAAERSPEDAFRFFRSEDFPEVIPPNDHRGRALWRGLSLPPAGREAMEEFLAGTGLKQPVTVTADESEVSFYSIKDTTQEWIRLRRSGWGSIVMSVSTDADFIELPVTRITEDSFVGSTCDIPYRIIVGSLGEGVRTGNVWIEAPGCSIRFHVTATSGREEYEEQRAKVDRNMAKLYELRLQYMLDRIDRKKYVTESLSLIGTHYCFSTEKLTLMRLYQAYLEKLRGNADEASAILREFRQVRFPEEEQEEELCCLYLRSLLGEEGASSEDTAIRIRSRFDGRYGSYILLKLLFLTNPDIGHYPRRRKKAAEQMFEAGVRSPFLYAELIRDLRADDSLVTSLSDCMVHTLLFAAKNDLLTEDLALRTAYLSANEKCFSPLILRILTVSYRLWPVSGILEAIVRLLMKGQPRDGSCFPWYEKAVEQHLRVIRLYEYYIESMPENRMEVLPLPVLKYFALSPESVSEESRARVYANVIRNRENDPDTFDELIDDAREFAAESLEKGRIGTDYAVLYQEFMRDLPEGQSLDTLTEAVFSERIVVDDSDVRSVVVIHDGLKEESVVPVVRGRAYIRRYTDDAQIIFENAASRRFITGAQYLLTPVMDRQEFLPTLKTRPFMRGGLLLNCVRELENVPCTDASGFAFWKDAARAEELTDDIRMEARRKIINYLADHPETGFFHSGTPQRVMDLYAEADKAKLTEVLLHGDLYREAYEQLVKSGQDGVPADMLVFIAGRIIRDTGDEKDEKLIKYCRDVYDGGKYDETILRYLTEYMSGSTQEMMELRRRAESFYIDTFALDDRLLSAVVREKKRPAGADEVFASYISHGG
ncbi:MAG: DUF5717 family protein, partial [Lachnospiraceae bacterium]|nr:DUF5717 family protein [Lachnospiraceae bacterium]